MSSYLHDTKDDCRLQENMYDYSDPEFDQYVIDDAGEVRKKTANLLEYIQIKEGGRKFAAKNYRVLKQKSYCDEILGKPYLLAGSSLRTIDWSKSLNLLSHYGNDDYVEPSSLQVVRRDDDKNIGLFTMKDLLSSKECENVIGNCTNDSLLQEISNIKGYDRHNSRLVVFDDNLGDLLWKRLEPSLNRMFQNKKLCPLGFNVVGGEWSFSGVNEAMRFNKYESQHCGNFSPHRDAQFCRSGDERSLLSLVIYLNGDFSGGETSFFFPKDESIKCKGMTMTEELKINGGLQFGYDPFTVKPASGTCVIFTQNLIHESTPLIHHGDENKCKYIIKTDIMVEREQKFGFSVTQAEKEDYIKCIDYFRTAQQAELAGEDTDIIANETYEKSLSIRYSYPTLEMVQNWSTTILPENVSSVESEPIPDNHDETSSDQKELEEVPSGKYDTAARDVFPIEIWLEIMKNSGEKDKQRLVSAYPELADAKRHFDAYKFIPTYAQPKGIMNQFHFLDEDFAENNIEACSRVLAVYSIFLLGHAQNSEMYIVDYKPDTNEALAVPLNQLLKDVFYGENSYGCIMKVTQQNKKKKHPLKDLSASVDRRFMATAFGQEFIGCGNLDNEVICQDHVVYDRGESEIDFKGLPRKLFYNYADLRSIDARGRVYNHKEHTLDFQTYPGNRHRHSPKTEKNIDNNYLFPLVTNCGFNWSNTPNKNWRKHTQGFAENIPKFTQGHCSGAAIMSVLQQPLQMEGSDQCICSRRADSNHRLYQNCDKQVFNHLIADFGRHEFVVTKCDTTKQGGFEDPFQERLVGRKNKKRIILNRVDIKPFKSPTPLYHAGADCGCTIPDLELDSYVNIRSYPYLDHLYVMWYKSKNNPMKARTCYGGIAAL